jgi:histone H3/H4
MDNAAPETGAEGKEVLIVASKLKNYIRNKSGMNTSAAVMDRLSDLVRNLCDQAVENAKREGRKTVMDRDFG